MRSTHLLPLAAIAAALVAPTAAAGDETVDSGALTATVGSQGARLALSSGLAGGTLSVTVGGVAYHATGATSTARDGAAVVLTLATDDPGGRTIAARVEPAGEGSIRLVASVPGAERLGVGFDAPAGERYLGFGERSNAVDQAGNEVENYVGEGPYQPDEAVIVDATVPPWGHHDRRDATYFPVPWLLSTRGYGVLIENDETSRFQLGTAGTWSLEADAAELRVRFFAGPKPADALRRMTAATGRQPKPQAPWFFGPWVHTGQENAPPASRERAAVRALRGGDAPVSAVETHMRYLPCGVAQGKDASEKARSDYFHSQGLPMLSYFNPEVCRAYTSAFDDGAARGVFQETATGEPYVFDAYVGDRTPPQTPVAQIDFTNPAAQAYWDGLLDQAVSGGKDGWMEDFGEYTPPDAVSANGRPGTQMHNAYPVAYHCAGWDYAERAPRPIARHIRSGWTGVAPCAQIVWGGDPTTSWGYDGLASALKEGLTMGLSGISIWGSDTGGFFSFGKNRLTPELLKRWIQFSSVSGVMRTKYAGPGSAENFPRPQVFDKAILPTWRRYAKLRTQLYPYLAAADAEYRSSGLPIMRQLALVYPDDATATGRDDEYMFGPDLLAAPVIEPGARTRSVYVPEGRWIDVWRSAAYEEGSGGIVPGKPKFVTGGRTVRLPAPLDQLPLLARAGTLLALLPPDVDTLSDYGSARGLVHLADRRNQMDIVAYPRGTTRASFGADGESLSSREATAGWSFRITGNRQRVYTVRVTLGTLTRPFTPCRATLKGGRIEQWSYSARTSVLTMKLKTRRGALRVLSCR